MKKIIFLLVIILIANCKDDVNSYIDPIFDQEDISNLSIESFSNFWQGDSLWVNDNPGAFIRNYDGYLKSIDYRSEYKVIEVIVFKTKQIAIEAMNEFRFLISAMTEEGNTNEIFHEKWWYVVGTNNQSIWVNKNNTIIFLSNTLAEDENISINTALEIMGRIESLSK